jgi:hypothetical protein
MSLIKSKERVADHGEVFTPAWMVEAMLDLVQHETERIDSRFLEPACGSGNFLVQILRRKLAAVEIKYGRSEFEKRHFALLAADVHLRHRAAARQHRRMSPQPAEDLRRLPEAGRDRTTCTTRPASCSRKTWSTATPDHAGQRQVSPSPSPNGATWARASSSGATFASTCSRRPSAYSAEGDLFANLGKHEIFMPTKTYPPMTVGDLAAGLRQAAVGTNAQGGSMTTVACFRAGAALGSATRAPGRRRPGGALP